MFISVDNCTTLIVKMHNVTVVTYTDGKIQTTDTKLDHELSSETNFNPVLRV
jgi:hypothetical protein